MAARAKNDVFICSKVGCPAPGFAFAGIADFFNHCGEIIST